MSQACLREFPKVSPPGSITVAEYGAQLISLPSNHDNPADGREFSEKLLSYHHIDGNNLKGVVPYKIQSIRTTKYSETLILQRDQGVIKGMLDAFMDAGVKGLEQYLNGVQKTTATNLFYGILRTFCTVTDRLYKLKRDTEIALFPHLGLQSEEIIQQSSQVRDWQKSWTKAVAWHPNFSKLALALNDDTIRIFTVDEEIIPMLRSHDQRIISCISWRPHTEVELAVGVESGILIWHMNSPLSIKPGGCQTQLLSAKNHSPVTSVEYSCSGLLLLSSSTYDASVYVWDVSTWKNTPLRRLGGGGVPFACWSPHEDRILTTSPTSVFRIWNRKNRWAPRRWETPKYPIEAACWNPDGSTLVFASAGMIYAVYFALTEIDIFINENDSVATPIFDVSESIVLSEDEKLEYKVGGRVRKLDWDPSGSRLAIFFDDSELVAVFRVQHKSINYLAPCGFIRGFPDEYPVAIAFQKDFRDGALLAIAWNSGRLQYFPFVFAVAGLAKNLLHQDHYNTPSIAKNSPQRPSVAKNAFQSTGSTFRTTYFSAPSEINDSNYTSSLGVSMEPHRLFSIDGRTPEF